MEEQKTMVVVPVLLLLGSLFLCGGVEAQSTVEILKDAALKWQGTLTCEKWDCNCTFTRQRGCCCAANDMYHVEEATFARIKNLWHSISALSDHVHELTASGRVSFKACMDPNVATQMRSSSDRCFGPFNTNVPIPYATVTLNDGDGYNTALGIFTAPIAGYYAFSFTVYSNVAKDQRMYHKVQLMKNGDGVSSVWENNREDGEDSATQFVMLNMRRGDQVYMELTSGRQLCNELQYNMFSGYMVYPSIEE